MHANFLQKFFIKKETPRLNLLILKGRKDYCRFPYFCVDFVRISTEYGRACFSASNWQGFQVSFGGTGNGTFFFLTPQWHACLMHELKFVSDGHLNICRGLRE